MKAREFVVESAKTAPADRIWNYVDGIHPNDQKGGGFLKKLILRYPQYELQRVPLSSLHLPDQEYDDEEQEPKQDPYNRVQTVDPEHAGEYSARFVDRRPIVTDSDGWIIDGNHRAWAAANLLNKSDIMAWVPVKELNELGNAPADYKPNRKRKRSLFHSTVDGHWVDVFFDRSEFNDTLHITFTVNSDYDAPSRPTSASKSTVKILSTVLNVIKQQLPEYVAKARPPGISFTAKGDNRANLYRRYFVPVVQNILGPKWQHEEYPSMGMTVFHWKPVRKQDVNEISDERLQSYLSRADQQVSNRMDRMAQARERLNKGYEIYHADRPAGSAQIVDRFEANTPALAQQYYEKFIRDYVSDVDFDLRLRRSTGIMEEDATAPQYVYRVDSQPIHDFDASPQTYKHTSDWQQSGLAADPQNDWTGKKVKTAKGTFAGTLERVAPYATGNAKETRFLQITNNNGQDFIYFDRKDLPKIRSKQTYLTVFNGKNFKETAPGKGEYFSAKPGTPVKQEPITDPTQFITNAGWIVRVTDNLATELARAKKLHSLGKIQSYGGEGLGVQESKVNEIARIPQRDLDGWGDKDTLEPMTTPPKGRKPLPGGSGYTYAVNRGDPEFMEIMIFDGDTLAAELDLFATLDPMKTWRVETVITDPDYRGRGMGKALYGIALSILKLTIEAGETQTKFGQQMWLMLSSIPGVEVLGYAMAPTDRYRPRPGDKIVDRNDTWTRYTFPVEPGKRSMRSTRSGTGIYSSQYVSMIAKWTGQ